MAAQNLVRLAVLAGDDAWRARRRPLVRRLMPVAAENLFGHMALLNALDLRLRAAEIVVTGSGPQADALAAAALKISFAERILVRAPTPDALPPAHPARDKIAAVPGGRGLRLPWRALLAAGDRAASVGANVNAMRT